jgi:mRNA interferase RelE/StbE
MTDPPHYTVGLMPSFVKALERLPKQVIAHVTKAINGLAIEPRPRGSLKMVGEESMYRLRVGDYRIIYRSIALKMTS